MYKKTLVIFLTAISSPCYCASNSKDGDANRKALAAQANSSASSAVPASSSSSSSASAAAAASAAALSTASTTHAVDKDHFCVRLQCDSPTRKELLSFKSLKPYGLISLEALTRGAPFNQEQRRLLAIQQPLEAPKEDPYKNLKFLLNGNVLKLPIRFSLKDIDGSPQATHPYSAVNLMIDAEDEDSGMERIEIVPGTTYTFNVGPQPHFTVSFVPQNT